MYSNNYINLNNVAADVCHSVHNYVFCMLIQGVFLLSFFHLQANS